MGVTNLVTPFCHFDNFSYLCIIKHHNGALKHNLRAHLP